MIKKVSEGYKVYSMDGKTLSRVYGSLKEASRRLHQIEWFKNRGK